MICLKIDIKRVQVDTSIGMSYLILSLLLVAGWGDTAYYPSNADLQCSLTIANSCSSEFTLRTMFYVSLLVPFVFGYIAYVSGSSRTPRRSCSVLNARTASALSLSIFLATVTYQLPVLPDFSYTSS